MLNTATPSAVAAVVASSARYLGARPPWKRLAASAAAFTRTRAADVPHQRPRSSHPRHGGAAARGSWLVSRRPAPLPGALGLSMEAHSTLLLWHTALLGPSAEARAAAATTFGALSRFRGLGLKLPAEAVLSLDGLQVSRVRAADMAPPSPGGEVARPRQRRPGGGADGRLRHNRWQTGGRVYRRGDPPSRLSPPSERWLQLGVGTAVALRMATATARPRRRVDERPPTFSASCRSPAPSDGGWSIEGKATPHSQGSATRTTAHLAAAAARSPAVEAAKWEHLRRPAWCFFLRSHHSSGPGHTWKPGTGCCTSLYCVQVYLNAPAVSNSHSRLHPLLTL